MTATMNARVFDPYEFSAACGRPPPRISGISNYFGISILFSTSRPRSTVGRPSIHKFQKSEWILVALVDGDDVEDADAVADISAALTRVQSR